MKNQNAIFAVMMLLLMSMLFFLTKNNAPKYKVALWNIPLSKGCVWPIRQVKHTKTEIKHIVPVAQIYKCSYDKIHRLVKVSTFDFERGYQMKIPTEEVLYEWDRLRLTQYSIRKASHGNGEVDVEIYTLHR
jgi:hypothetical protein